MYSYEFTSRSLKQLKKLDKKTQFRIIEKLDYISNAPNPLIYADSLIDSRLGDYRVRIGDYRVIFDLEVETLVILKIGHRRDIYK